MGKTLKFGNPGWQAHLVPSRSGRELYGAFR